MATYRVSPPRVFGQATHAGKPPMASAGSADAYRQAQFVLDADTNLILDGLNLESTIADGATGAKFRNQRVTSGLLYWSRSWLSRLQALHAIEWGNYAASLPLIRAAADYQSAGLALLGADGPEWQAWLDGDAIRLAPEQHALEIQLHAFRSAETMATHPILGPVYRAATDLALPHFGSTLLVAGAESDTSRIAATFADRDFHLGWAELALTFLLQLAEAQAGTLLSHAETFGIADHAALEGHIAKLQAASGRRDRCRIEITDVDGHQRYLVSNWRRNPGGAFMKVLL